MADNRSVAIVTGASAGIGAETALAYARRGWAVVLAARRRERLEELAGKVRDAGGEPLVAPTDVTRREQVDAMVAAAIERFGRVDSLVNNAGYGVFGLVHEVDETDLRRVFEVNFFGLWYGLVAAAPIMIDRGAGHIFNVSSVIGKRGTPYHGAYCATKGAVNQLTESARVELAPRGVHVTLVCPTRTATEFFDKGAKAHAAGKANAKFVTPMPARKVGERIAAVTGRRKSQIIFGAGGKLMAWLNALAPPLVDRGMELYRKELAKRISETDSA